MSNIENIVMGRVRRIHTLRRYINRTTLKMYGTGILAYVLLSVVSVSSVYANMPSLLTPYDAVAYIVAAFSTTEAVTKLLLVGIVGTSIFALLDIRKNLKEHKVLFPQM